MEVAGVVYRPIPSISGGGGIDVQSRSLSSSKPSLLGFSSRSRASSRVGCRGITKSCNPGLGLGISDNAHLQYYYGGGGSTTERRIRCASAGIGNMEKLKEKETTKANKKNIKKRLKLLKGLSRDLSEFSELGFGLDPLDNGLLDQVKGQMISEATELLLGQLQQLKAEEKEIKRKMKEEKAKLKASANMRKRVDCESSSSSSESIDSACGEVLNMNSLKTTTQALAVMVNESQPPMQQPTFTLPTHESNTIIEITEDVATSTTTNSSTGCCNSLMVGGAYNGDGGGRSAVVVEAEKKKVGVCMGGKCKKSGGALLLEEFQKVLGVEAAVGCKCMGTCRNAPNVRILEDDSVSVRNAPTTNPLFIGVGFEDVNLIVANYYGGETNWELSLGCAAAS